MPTIQPQQNQANNAPQQNRHLTARHQSLNNAQLEFSAYQFLLNIINASFEYAGRTLFSAPSMIYNSCRDGAIYSMNTLDHYTWSGAADRLTTETIPNRQALESLCIQTSEWISRMLATPENESQRAWHDLVNLMKESPESLNAMNHLIHAIATGHNLENLLSILPVEAAAFVRAQLTPLKASYLIKAANIAINLRSESGQISTAENTSDFVSKLMINNLRTNCFPNNQIPLANIINEIPLPDSEQNRAQQPDPNGDMRANPNAQAQAQAADQANEANEANEVAAIAPLTQDEKVAIANKLWLITAELLDASARSEPDPNRLNEAETPIVPISDHERCHRMKEVIFDHLSLFTVLLGQDNFRRELQNILELANLPKSVHDFLNQKMRDSIEQDAALFNTARNVIASLAPFTSEADKHQALMRIPDHEVLGISNEINDMLDTIDPYEELPFFKQFADELVSSININAVQTVAERLTKGYFPAMNQEFKRDIAVAVVELGQHAKLGDRIGAIGQAAGIGFQKGMQLFGDGIANEEMREALDALKQSVKEMPHEKAIAIINKELDALNNSPTNTRHYEIATENGKPAVSEALHSATIGQVHQATLKITGSTGKPKYITVALKVKRDGAQRRFDHEREGLKAALKGGYALTLVDQQQPLPSQGKSKVAIKKMSDSQYRVRVFDQEKNFSDHTLSNTLSSSIAFHLIQQKFNDPESIDDSELITQLIANTNIPLTVESNDNNESITATIDELMQGFEDELNFQGGEYVNGKTANILYNKASGKVKLRAAGPIAATPNLVIQHWAPGSSINKQWNRFEEREENLGFNDPADESLQQEKLQFLQDVKTGLELEQSAWVQGFVKGGDRQGQRVRYLDSDRHDGNANYDPESKAYTLLDFGAGVEISKHEKDQFIKIVSSASTADAKSMYDALASLIDTLPKSQGNGGAGRDTHVLKGIQEVLKPNGEALLRDKVNNLIGPNSITTMIRESSPLTLNEAKRGRRVGFQGFIDHFQTPRLRSRRQQNAIERMLNRQGVMPDTQMVNDIGKEIRNPNRNAANVRGVLSGALASDHKNDVYLIRTLEKVADVLGEHGYPAPKLIILLNRGSKFLSDKIKLNNDRIKELKVKINNGPYCSELKKSAAKIKTTNIGNVYVGALSGEAVNISADLFMRVGTWMESKMKNRE